jgi:hypothetical protein
MLANADEKFHEQQIRLTTTELSCTDLNSYKNALDRAIIAFHTSKMQEINRIIRELWTATYQGTGGWTDGGARAWVCKATPLAHQFGLQILTRLKFKATRKAWTSRNGASTTIAS